MAFDIIMREHSSLDSPHMPSNILECPIAKCPAKNEVIKAAIIPVGSFVNSPGGSYVYEVLSPPVERKYLDFKGLFEKPFQASKLNEELAEYDRKDADCICRFFSEYRVSMSYKPPSFGRMFWVWLAALLGKQAPHWYFNLKCSLSPFWLMYHADESSLQHQGSNYYRSYQVKIWFISGNKWASSKPKVTTIRWEPAFIDSLIAV